MIQNIIVRAMGSDGAGCRFLLPQLLRRPHEQRFNTINEKPLRVSAPQSCGTLRELFSQETNTNYENRN
jgi:hypothetical protein